MRYSLLLLVAALSIVSEAAIATEPIPIIFDTDIGSAIDDAHALALVLASDELELLGVTTCTSGAEDRAWMVCRFLTSAGRERVPVAFGHDPQPKSEIDWQIQYRRHPAVVWNRTTKPAKESAVDLMKRLLQQQHERDKPPATILAVGPLTNVARLLKEHPESKQWIERIVLMGGALEVGYNGKPPAVAEWNIKNDIAAAKVVFTSGVPLHVVPIDAALGVKIDEKQKQRLFGSHVPIAWELAALSQLDDGAEGPALFDPVAVRMAIDPDFCETKPLCLFVQEDGIVRPVKGKTNATVATEVNTQEFVRWYIDRLAASGEPRLPRPPIHRTQAIKRRGLPRVVHAFEDYDNDIEKRWWMTGKLELNNLPQGSRRACRAVLTQDYDAKMGDTKSRYKAVIFNPVPGPPMGEKTRLSFRYKLSGTDTLRVQLFSLSNGYHRYLSLDGLPQDRWAEATVDMTQMRRPDGSGGPLAKDERIDDIQFYIDPRADLIIDEMILYDEAPDSEERAFPKRLLFTGWFDTGKQGNEWPGDFAIVLHEKPRTWDAARSVINSQTQQPWIRLHMRGQRRLDKQVELRFQYRLKATKESISVSLYDSATEQEQKRELTDLRVGQWQQASVRFSPFEVSEEFTHADELRFYLPVGAELLIDDLLLYIP